MGGLLSCPAHRSWLPPSALAFLHLCFHFDLPLSPLPSVLCPNSTTVSDLQPPAATQPPLFVPVPVLPEAVVTIERATRNVFHC